MTYAYISQGEAHKVNERGEITRAACGWAYSGGWKVRGLVRFNNFGNVAEFIPFPQCMSVGRAALRYKNGKPRLFLADLDHGTKRVQMAGLSYIGSL